MYPLLYHAILNHKTLRFQVLKKFGLTLLNFSPWEGGGVGEGVGGFPVRISGSYNFISTPAVLSIQIISYHLHPPPKFRLSTKFIFLGDIVPLCIYQSKIYLYYLNNTPVHTCTHLVYLVF
jgi:hypothetical protein